MLLPHHDSSTSLEECLLIISENSMRYLWLLENGHTDTEEFVWLANALDYHNEGVADMHILGLIEVGEGVSVDPAAPDVYTIEPRGRELLELAAAKGVDFQKLAIEPRRFQ